MKQWRIEISLKSILGLQLAMVVMASAEIIGAGSFIPPILKSFIGFVYLTFVPGFLILKIMRIQRTGLTKIILYSVGLSIAFLMFTGLLLNMAFHEVGISRPISYIPLVGSIIIATFILYVLSLVRSRNYSSLIRIDLREILSPSFLFLLSLPFLSVLGTYMVNAYESNVILLLLIIVIVCTVIMVSNRSSRRKLYPIALFLIAISLLYHRSLITNYLTGWDIHGEYYEYNLVETHQYWNSTRSSEFGSVLSISILPTIYSFFTDMNGVWIFKVIFPLIYALVPIGLFEVFRKQLDDKAAFLSSFFFMSFFTFFQEMLQLGRQQIAELFFVLCVLIMLETRIRPFKKTFLLIVFSVSLVLSHYLMAFAFAGYIVLTWVTLFLRKVYSGKSLKKEMTGLYVTFFVVFTLCWYMFVSNAVVLDRFASSIYNVFYALKSFFEIEARHPTVQQAIGTTAMESWGREISRIIFYVANLFILVGVLKLVIKTEKPNFDRKFITMAFISLAILFISLILPFFPQIMNATRLYHVTLIFLAPFFILGGKQFFKIFEYVLKVSKRHYVNFILIILLSNFLFSTGFIFEVTGDVPSSVSLSKYRMDGPYFSDGEVLGAKWLLNLKEDNQSLIYGDEYGWLIFLGYLPIDELGYFTNETEQVPENTYVFLRYLNVKEEMMLVRTSIEVDEWQYINTSHNPGCSDVIEYGNKIYDNGYCNVFLRD